jgi:2-oxoisovalerate dehydrogenase E1 component
LDRGRAFGLNCWRLSDVHPDFLMQADEIVAAMRRDCHPGLLVIDTRRLGPHSKGDDFRDPDEIEALRRGDPLVRLGQALEPAVRVRIDSECCQVIDEVIDRASKSPEARFVRPPVSIFSVAPLAGAREPPEPAANVRTSLNAALRRLLTADARVILLGEDLHDPYGGAFKVTAGLSTLYPDRVLSTPISEAGIVGSAIGLALDGFRPVVEVMFADFLTLAADQIYNHAVKFPALSEETQVPLVIRTPSGGRRGYGPTHSQSPENLFTSVPGLSVVFPSHRHDPGVLLEAAVLDWPYPVLFFEHKLLYSEKVTAGDFVVAKPHQGDPAAGLFPTLWTDVPRPDLTLVAYGGMVPIAEEVGRFLATSEELRVRLVVPSLLAPLPRHTLLPLMFDSPRIVVVEESHHQFGISSEFAACLLEEGYRGRFLRVGAQPVPIPAARSLERDVLPDADVIIDRVLETF